MNGKIYHISKKVKDGKDIQSVGRYEPTSRKKLHNAKHYAKVLHIQKFKKQWTISHDHGTMA